MTSFFWRCRNKYLRFHYAATHGQLTSYEDTPKPHKQTKEVETYRPPPPPPHTSSWFLRASACSFCSCPSAALTRLVRRRASSPTWAREGRPTSASARRLEVYVPYVCRLGGGTREKVCSLFTLLCVKKESRGPLCKVWGRKGDNRVL